MLSLPWSFFKMTDEPAHIKFHVVRCLSHILGTFGPLAHIMSSKCKAPSSSNNAPKGGKQEPHDCPNPLCNCQFVGSCHLKIHLSKTKAYTDALFGIANNNEGILDVLPDNNEQGGNEPIDTNFEPVNDADDMMQPCPRSACNAGITRVKRKLVAQLTTILIQMMKRWMTPPIWKCQLFLSLLLHMDFVLHHQIILKQSFSN
jgi:hypothetical protein